MKNAAKLIPTFLYPYLYLLCISSLFIGWISNHEKFVLALLILGILCNLYSLVPPILLLFTANRGKITAEELAKLTMLVKTIQIPAYLLNFILALIGFVMSVWGFPFILFSILADFGMILVTGLLCVGANVAGRKERLLTAAQAVLFSILGFVYCVDVISSIVLFCKIRKNRQTVQTITPV